jgi:integration host factor subunit alpha
MVKSDIVVKIQAKTGLLNREATAILESVLAIMKETLENGESIKITGFGGFIVKSKADRLGRNPQTGEKMTIVARRVLSFKPSLLLKSAINA